MKTTCLLLITLSVFAISATADDLQMVIEAFRHGARAPIAEAFDFPKGIMEYAVGLGNLTPPGMRMHYLIGTEFRRRYIEETPLLSSSFNQSEIYIRSTDVNRTLQSVESQVMGLYPLGTGPSLKNVQVADLAVPPMTVKDLDHQKALLGLDALPQLYQPIPINTVPVPQDFMLSAWGGSCEKIQVLKDQALNSDATQQYLEESIYPLLPRLSAAVGISVDDLKDPEIMVNTYSELNCGYYNGKTMPEGIDAAFIKEIQTIPIFFFYYYFFGIHEAAMLGSSQFFQEMHDLLTQKISGASTVKLGLFSAHDITLANLMAGLGQDALYPDFAANMVFELYSKDGAAQDSQDYSDYYVTADFNDLELTIPGCGDYKCDLNNFVDYLNANIIQDVPTACEVPTFTTSTTTLPTDVPFLGWY